MFSQPLLTRRCVVPSTGFFDWVVDADAEAQLPLFPVARKKNAKKTKLLFRRPDEPMLYMAGMMNTFEDKDDFVILTTAANNSMMPFHDRMPVILAANECIDWLRSDVFMREVLTRKSMELEWSEAS
jgi:putative SOS response-associated peptidase YedK